MTDMHGFIGNTTVLSLRLVRNPFGKERFLTSRNDNLCDLACLLPDFPKRLA